MTDPNTPATSNQIKCPHCGQTYAVRLSDAACAMICVARGVRLYLSQSKNTR